MRILGEVGVRFLHPEILEYLRQNNVQVSEDLAFFTKEQILAHVAKAPAAFTLHARNPKYDMVIGGAHHECAVGYGCPTIINAAGDRRDAVLEDCLTFTRLVQQSDLFNINGGILAQPADVPPDRSHLVMLYAALALSDKCLMGIPGPAGHIQETMEMLAIAFGGRKNFTARPHVLTMISTISPLVVDQMALDSILSCCAHNQPMIISPAPAAGTTGPIGLAGNVALAAAEALATIAVIQMIRPGTPVIFGLQSYGADLRTGNIAIGSPAYAIQAGYCAALARRYGLPSRCGGATTDACAVTAQSGYESMMSMLTSFQNGINLMVHSAGILDSFAGISYEQFFVDLEIIKRIKYYQNGIRIETDADLGFDLIQSVGPGGEFLTTADTVQKCRTHSFLPDIGDRNTAPGESVNAKFLSSIEKRMTSALDAYHRPAFDPALQTEIEHYLVDTAGVDRFIINHINANHPINYPGRG